MSLSILTVPASPLRGQAVGTGLFNGPQQWVLSFQPRPPPVHPPSPTLPLEEAPPLPFWREAAAQDPGREGPGSSHLLRVGCCSAGAGWYLGTRLVRTLQPCSCHCEVITVPSVTCVRSQASVTCALQTGSAAPSSEGPGVHDSAGRGRPCYMSNTHSSGETWRLSKDRPRPRGCLQSFQEMPVGSEEPAWSSVLPCKWLGRAVSHSGSHSSVCPRGLLAFPPSASS